MSSCLRRYHACNISIVLGHRHNRITMPIHFHDIRLYIMPPRGDKWRARPCAGAAGFSKCNRVYPAPLKNGQLKFLKHFTMMLAYRMPLLNTSYWWLWLQNVWAQGATHNVLSGHYAICAALFFHFVSGRNATRRFCYHIRAWYRAHGARRDAGRVDDFIDIDIELISAKRVMRARWEMTLRSRRAFDDNFSFIL